MEAMSCAEACAVLAGEGPDDVFVVTMSAMKTFPGIAADAKFVSCVPLMGGAAAIGLGIATARPDIRVWVLDGDASLLMELGALVTVAEGRPPNLVHVLFDNRVQYAGTANLAIPNAGGVDFCAMAKAAGYAHAHAAATAVDLRRTCRSLPRRAGPVFVCLRIAPDPPTYSGTCAQREIPDNQMTRMGDEARRVRALLGGSAA
jgi:phosphonopyruvate decarboxylase